MADDAQAEHPQHHLRVGIRKGCVHDLLALLEGIVPRLEGPEHPCAHSSQEQQRRSWSVSASICAGCVNNLSDLQHSSAIYLSPYLPINQSTNQSINQSIYLSIYLSIYRWIDLCGDVQPID